MSSSISSRHWIECHLSLVLVLVCGVACHAQSATSPRKPFTFSPNASLAWPTSPEYKIAYVQRSTNMNAFPSFIFSPATVADVVSALNYAKKMGIKVSVKTTGHDYCGRSSRDNTLNILMTKMDKVIEVDTKNNTITVQGGATFGKIQDVLMNQYGRLVVSGQLATVAPGGCLAGGCHGPMIRQHGLGADNIVAIDLVKPNGEVVRVSKLGQHRMEVLPNGELNQRPGSLLTNDTSLFWAMRGGGGGRWGVVVQWTLNTFPVPKQPTTMELTFGLFDPETGTPIVLDVLKSFFFNASWWGGIPNTVVIPTIKVYPGLNKGDAQILYVGDNAEEARSIPGIAALFASPAITVVGGQTWPSMWDFVLALSTDELEGKGQSFKRQVGLGNVFITEEDLPDAPENLVEAAKNATDAAFFIWCLFGGASANHPEANLTSVSPSFRKAVCEVTYGSNNLDPAQDASISQRMSAIGAPLLAAYPSSYVSEVSWQPGTGVPPLHDWQTRFWGDNYARLLKVQKANDPNRLLADTVYSVGWKAPKA